MVKSCWAAMASRRKISFGDDGSIEHETPDKALVRFPSWAEQGLGIVEVARPVRVRELAMRNKLGSNRSGHTATS